LATLHQILPARVKFALKPYYRKIFPNKLHAYINLTWRCNYRCSYCPVVTNFAFTSVVDRSGERSGEEWIAALEKLPPATIYFSGGEPFVFSDLPVIVNRLPEKHHVQGIVTNLSAPVSVYRKIKKRIHLNASFHREFADASTFTAKVKELCDQFHIHVNIVATPENLPLLEQIADGLAESKVALHVDPYVDVRGFQYSEEQLKIVQRFVFGDRSPESLTDYSDFSPKRCSAGRNYITFSPDGSAYTCYGGMNFIHSTLYSDIIPGRDLSLFRMGNLFDSNFHLNEEDVICSMPCNAACDRDMAIIHQIDNAKTPVTG
jgi:MoaA/NifB/PqqE/SkfB family radical SAM enzyme